MIHSSIMADIMQLTRRGKLADATALIQQSLGAAMPVQPDAPSSKKKPAYQRQAALLPRVLPAPVGQQQAGAKPASRRRTSAKASFQNKEFRSPAGSLHYRLYIPANAAADMPLVVMLHGCTQSAADFARGTGMNALADETGCIVAYPCQTHSANAQKCWNWFKPGDQQRDKGEPALIAGITRQIIAEQRCDGQRVYIAGLSAGGAAAAVMANAYPELYAAVGVHSGLPCGAARDIMSALIAMKQGSKIPQAASSAARFVPVITFHGDRDTTVSDINSRTIAAIAGSAAGDLTAHSETGQIAGGRSFTRTIGTDADGAVLIEQWAIHGGGHAWSGGSPAGSYTDKLGPDASREMLRFFLAHRIA